MSVSPVPSDYPTLMPYLIVDEPEHLLDFATGAFGGEIIERMEDPEGGVRHAEVRIGTSVVMMGPARPEWPAMPTMLYMYVEDCDDGYARALDCGGASHQEPEDMPYGDRTAAVKDPCGNLWYLATRKENLSAEEMAARMNEPAGNA